MGAFARVINAVSPNARRMRRLALIAGASEALATTLKRHAAMAEYSSFRTALEEVAEAEAADAKFLRDLLLADGVWPTPRSRSSIDGGNNWQRASADLAEEVELVRALSAAIAEWEGVDHVIANQLRVIALHKEITAGHLRDLALRCDPQALD